MRILSTLFSLNDLNTISTLSEYLLKNQGQVVSLQEVTKVLIPPYLDEMLQYLHQYVITIEILFKNKKDSCTKYVSFYEMDNERF